MRVLCVGRHAFLSEHLCRVFGAVGAFCEPAVGLTDASRIAARFEPDVVVCDGDLLTSAVLEGWAREPVLKEVPVLAVSLTRRPDDALPVELVTSDPMTAVYLPSLDTAQLKALLVTMRRPRGVSVPPDWRVHVAPTSAHQR